ncbi:HNH endonuclease [Homoserinibacter sp. GY 40078]|uniref:HNH endonuclease n=1 Tax=Homoserinibacter sp. GY 40078 TaxID=2603275 RepID=UPI0011CC8FD7|nr:HNH endonuclease signature motif containing protein [Homoserinibacter sp. GY 40078]TXK17394.1 HNH endonuclease [Homoserinibacter sp. GY 40078]
MAISRSEKLLWARSHNRCAICRRPLTIDADSAALPGLILGQVAHIIARQEAGPRGSGDGRHQLDDYENLILLCADDHKRVDDQPDVFTVDELRERKRAHERWAEERFADDHLEPVRLQKGPGEDALKMHMVVSGAEVWDLVAGAGLWNMRSVEGDGDPDASDAADEFLSYARDVGVCAEETLADGFAAVREVQRTLQSMLDGLLERGLAVYGRRVTRTLVGGVIEDPQPFDVTHLVVLDGEELRARLGIDDA